MQGADKTKGQGRSQCRQGAHLHTCAIDQGKAAIVVRRAARHTLVQLANLALLAVCSCAALARAARQAIAYNAVRAGAVWLY